jgi:hypothetical protein
MSVADVATLTLVKLKEYTSTTFVKATRGISRSEFMRRSRKAFLVCIVIGVAAHAAGFLFYRSTAIQTRYSFYQHGAAATRSLAQECRPFVLEKDVLMLNVALRSAEKADGLVYAAILDHQNQVLTRTGPEELTRTLPPLNDQVATGSLDGTGFTDLTPPGAQPLTLFFLPVTYSNIDIGKVMLAFSAEPLQQALSRLRGTYLTVTTAVTLLLVGLLVGLDRRQKKKSKELIQRLGTIDTIGPYHLISKVAAGGMAELYLADYVREDGFRRRVAVKRILPHFAAHEDFVHMFIREARLAALLQHPNIVQVFDYGKIADVSFIAMEYIDGKNLGEIISGMKSGVPIEPAVFVFSEICKGLEYSHTKADDQTGVRLNIVHRDISPQNILVSYQGEVKISDFGISKARSEPSLTQAGVLKGKLMYLAPEQLTGDDVDHRLDIYALGLVFYEVLTGQAAYRFDSEIEAIRGIPSVRIEPLKIRNPGVPDELDRIVMKCLDKNVATRYQSAGSIYADLTAFKRAHQIAFDAADLAAVLKQHFRPATPG